MTHGHRAALRLAPAQVLCPKYGPLPVPDWHIFLLLRCLLCLSEVNSSRLVSISVAAQQISQIAHYKIFTFPKLRALKTAVRGDAAPIAPPKARFPLYPS